MKPIRYFVGERALKGYPVFPCLVDEDGLEHRGKPVFWGGRKSDSLSHAASLNEGLVKTVRFNGADFIVDGNPVSLEGARSLFDVARSDWSQNAYQVMARLVLTGAVK